MCVSFNTLYQNISIVRHALRKVSNDNIIFIKTITRKGFQFNDAIKVDVSYNTCNPVELHEEVIDRENAKHQINKITLLYFSLISFVIGLIPALVINKINNNMIGFENNLLMANYKGCYVFYESNDLATAGLVKNIRLTDNVNYFSPLCGWEPVIYIPVSGVEHKFTTLLCRQQIESEIKINCESIDYVK